MWDSRIPVFFNTHLHLIMSDAADSSDSLYLKKGSIRFVIVGGLWLRGCTFSVSSVQPSYCIRTPARQISSLLLRFACRCQVLSGLRAILAELFLTLLYGVPAAKGRLEQHTSMAKKKFERRSVEVPDCGRVKWNRYPNSVAYGASYLFVLETTAFRRLLRWHARLARCTVLMCPMWFYLRQSTSRWHMMQVALSLAEFFL